MCVVEYVCGCGVSNFVGLVLNGLYGEWLLIVFFCVVEGVGG